MWYPAGIYFGCTVVCMLFVCCLYVYDITNTTSLFEIILFADDTTLLYSPPDISSKINSINTEQNEISNWFKANKLYVNAKNKLHDFGYYIYNK